LLLPIPALMPSSAASGGSCSPVSGPSCGPSTSGRNASSLVFFFQAGQLHELAEAALDLERQGARAVYFLPNPLRPDIASNRRSAAKADVIARHWLLIDCDPVRFGPDGTKLPDQRCPSSDGERFAAWRVLDRCRGTLEAAGLRGAIVGDSGNGWHLNYPIDLPNDEATEQAIKSLLHGLKRRCGDEYATVDTSTYDAPRMWRLYGTVTRKGEETPGRPYRRSQIVD
jgi:hypothetical protein